MYRTQTFRPLFVRVKTDTQDENFNGLQFITYTAVVRCVFELALRPTGTAIVIIEPTRSAITLMVIIAAVRLISSLVSFIRISWQGLLVVSHIFCRIQAR